MSAYRRLLSRGKFVQPPSGLELEHKVHEKSDPYTAFVHDLFIIDPEAMVNCSVVDLNFKQWCQERSRSDLLASTPTSSLLSQRLKEVPGLDLRTFKPHGQARLYVGLRLKTKEEKSVRGETSVKSVKLPKLERFA